MRIGVLTSSRADYGIYRPLLKALKADPYFELSIIAFGTHVSPYHGLSIKNIEADGFSVAYTINSLLLTDDENSVASSVALTALKFSDFWKEHKDKFDIIFCLGDRYEMFGAVSSGVPFGVTFAHLHGGETTLGAIDNIYRHSITLFSTLHFTSTEAYKKRVCDIIGQEDNVYAVGSLSLENLREIKLLSVAEFQKKWSIDMSIPTILITVHPETVALDTNQQNIDELLLSLSSVVRDFQLVFTMPNADTMGTLYRSKIIAFKEKVGERVITVENFGTESYFSCMRLCRFMLGNTSSGIIEAASLKKRVIDLGNRQQGRITGENVINVPFHSEKINAAVERVKMLGDYEGENPYFKSDVVSTIINILKKYSA